MAKLTKSLLPAIAAAVCLLSFSCSAPEDKDEGSAMVMYTWATADFPYLQRIAASYDDMLYWYNYVYLSSNYIDDDATDVPIPGIGSADIPNNIYYKDLPQDATKYKGVCLPISKGSYTAVATVNDPARNKNVYIVANYPIDSLESSGTTYFEVAFSAKSVLDGFDGKNDTTSWVFTRHGGNKPCPKND